MTTQQDRLGVALTKCFFCLKDNEIILNTRLSPRYTNAVKEMHGKIINMHPCNTCKDYMQNGIILISVIDSLSESNWNKQPLPNPYRGGGFAVITDDGLKRMLNDDSNKMLNFAIINRWMFIEHQAAIEIGIFSHEKNKKTKV